MAERFDPHLLSTHLELFSTATKWYCTYVLHCQLRVRYETSLINPIQFEVKK